MICKLLQAFLFVAAFAVGFTNLPARAATSNCDEPITLGTTISQTGTFSSQTENWKHLTIAFQDAINKGGGIEVKSCHGKVPVRFVIYDDQSSVSTAVSLYERLVTVDHVDFLVGPDWSALGGGPVSTVAVARSCT